jgi:hypothetical protein
VGVRPQVAKASGFQPKVVSKGLHPIYGAGMEHLEQRAPASSILLLLAKLWLVLLALPVLTASVYDTLSFANLASALALLSLMLIQVLSSGIVCSMLANNTNLVVA